MRVKQVTRSDSTLYGWVFECPGCATLGEHYTGKHVIYNDGRWKFNENFELPTFSPSILVRDAEMVCHSFIKEGKIQYLGDCTHPLRNQTIDLPEIDDYEP